MWCRSWPLRGPSWCLKQRRWRCSVQALWALHPRHAYMKRRHSLCLEVKTWGVQQNVCPLRVCLHAHDSVSVFVCVDHASGSVLHDSNVHEMSSERKGTGEMRAYITHDLWAISWWVNAVALLWFGREADSLNQVTHYLPHTIQRWACESHLRNNLAENEENNRKASQEHFHKDLIEMKEWSETKSSTRSWIVADLLIFGEPQTYHNVGVNRPEVVSNKRCFMYVTRYFGALSGAADND